VPAAPADPATLEPQAESVTPMNASADSSKPAKEQSAPPETAAESEAETPEAPASETPTAEPVAVAETTDDSAQADEPAKEAQKQ
jgi:hypothetical protein